MQSLRSLDSLRDQGDKILFIYPSPLRDTHRIYVFFPLNQRISCGSADTRRSYDVCKNGASPHE